MGVQTSAALGWIIQAAAAYPGAQKAVQDQLDEVVGKDRGHLLSSSLKRLSHTALFSPVG